MTEEGDPTNHASSPSLGGELSASNDNEGYLADNDTLSTSGTNENSGRASPNSSKAPTIRSYSSSIDRDALLHDVHGRTVNRTSNHYMLPADEAEHSRLDIQHEMLRLKMDGLFFRPDVVKQILAPRRNPVPAVLDIGTGSGSWVVDMAKAFPHARVVGLDLVPANLSSSAPANCTFECDDANLGLDHYWNAFDVVHIRCACSGFEDYRKFLQTEVVQVLRPGGVFLSVEGDLQLYDEDRSPVTAEDEGNAGFSFMQKMTSAAHNAMRELGPGIDAYVQIPQWLQEMDAWEETGEEKFFIAVGPWEESDDEAQTYISLLMRQDLIRLAQSFRPLLISHGHFAETVDRWITKVREELFESQRKLYVQWHGAWAIRKGR